MELQYFKSAAYYWFRYFVCPIKLLEIREKGELWNEKLRRLYFHKYHTRPCVTTECILHWQMFLLDKSAELLFKQVHFTFKRILASFPPIFFQPKHNIRLRLNVCGSESECGSFSIRTLWQPCPPHCFPFRNAYYIVNETVDWGSDPTSDCGFWIEHPLTWYKYDDSDCLLYFGLCFAFWNYTL